MTIKEAEDQYFLEVENCREQHILSAKKSRLTWNIIGSILIVIGIILLIVGIITPPEIHKGFEREYESESIEAVLEKLCGVCLLCIGVISLVWMNIKWLRLMKDGPQGYLPQIKNLYLNYLKCDELSADEKEYYKQKLEDIRNLELTAAIHSASAAASAAILFSALHR